MAVGHANGDTNGNHAAGTEIHPDTAALMARRRKSMAPNTATHMHDNAPLHMVRGQGSHLYDDRGQDYLDCVNNVAHVGHCHPKVTAAVCQQLATLNTNVRYLHRGVVDFAEEVAKLLPPELCVTYYQTSGSEANDLALRMAQIARPGARHVAVMGGAYHGMTTATLAMSEYKFGTTGGLGKGDNVHILPCPDTYRGHHLDGRASARAAIAEAEAQGERICAFFCESVLSCAGQVVLPSGYLQGAYEEFRAHGTVCIADEVQCGFGRSGSHFWCFEMQGVVPDIVSMGKPIGNGFPMSLLVARREVAQAFANGMEFFTTYGGCTAAGAAGLATLTVLQEERLQENAALVGQRLLDGLHKLQKLHPCMGDVRGMGLMIGVEIVQPGTTQHAPDLAFKVRDGMARRHVLVAVDGMRENVIKIKPPMCFSLGDADRLLNGLAEVLQHDMDASM